MSAFRKRAPDKLQNIEWDYDQTYMKSFEYKMCDND